MQVLHVKKKQHTFLHVCGCYKLVEHVQRLRPLCSCTGFLLHAIPHLSHPPLLSTILLSYQIKAQKNLFRLQCITLCQTAHRIILLMKRMREILSLIVDLMGLEILTVQKKPFSHIHFLFFPQIRLLTVAAQMLQEETEQKIKEREATLAERVPPLSMSGLSLQELLVLHFVIIFYKCSSVTIHNYSYMIEFTFHSTTTRGCILLSYRTFAKICTTRLMS